jgi:hypothetical protein
MNRYRLLIAPLLAGVALAGSPVHARSDAGRMADKLRDPHMQASISAAVRALSEAMLDLPIAPFLNAAEAVRDPAAPREVDPDLRLRDIAGPDGERVPDRLTQRLPAMMGAMGGMADAAEAMTPALKGVAHEMSRAMGEAVARARGAGEPDRAPDEVDDIPTAQAE